MNIILTNHCQYIGLRLDSLYVLVHSKEATTVRKCWMTIKKEGIEGAINHEVMKHLTCHLRIL